MEHLLWILGEECSEVAQRASKAARFGLFEIQPGQSLTNADRIVGELNDLIGVVSMLVEAGAIPKNWMSSRETSKKVAEIENFLRYSAKCETLD